MAKLLDQILVIDLESTCWVKDPPPGQISEIIEIGVATIDVATLQRGEKRSLSRGASLSVQSSDVERAVEILKQTPARSFLVVELPRTQRFIG